jgi:hypothetical protein
MMDYANLFTEIIPYAPGAPSAAVIDCIRSAAIEFCRRSLIWQVISDPDFLSATDDAFEIDAPDQGELQMVMDVWVDNYLVQPQPPDTMYRVGTSTPWPEATGTPKSYILEEGAIRFVPVPDANKPIVTRCAFRPTLDSTSIEDSLYNEYWPALRAGALAYLYEMPGQTWSNAQLMLMNEARFKQGIGDAKIAANRGRTRSQVRIELPRYL